MSICNDFFIGRIYTIVKKTENGNFNFENRARQWHGFVLMTEGEGTFIDESGNRHPFSVGDILLLGRGYHYRIQIPGKASYITTAFDFYIKGVNESRLFPQLLHLDSQTVAGFEKLAHIFSSQDENAIVNSRILLTSLYTELLRNVDMHTNSLNKEAELAEKIIRRTFRENLPIAEIANQCNISPSYLRAVFSRTFGVSITRYREQIRIEEAEVLIRCGFFTLHEIAEQLGYCDVFHFTKNFTKAKGISPSKYREQYLCEE